MTNSTFIERNGTLLGVDAPVGMWVLVVAIRNDIDIEGACEGSMACATCHVVVEPEWYGKLVPASEDEADMLDLVFGLRQTSRLGCQVVVTEEIGRASCRETVCQYVSISVVAVSLKQ